DEHDRPPVALDESRRNDPDDALVPFGIREDVRASATPPLRPRLDLLDRRPQDPLLDRLALAVQRLELAGQPVRLLLVLGEQELERGLRSAEAPGGVDPWREAEADRAFVDGGGIDACVAHE